LQEAPDPLSTIVWGNWLDIHPATADACGLSDGDIAAVEAPGSTIHLSVRKTTQVHPHCLAVAFGQGHTALGRLAAGKGANVFRLLAAMPLAGAFGRVKLAKTDRHDMFIYMSDSQRQYGREILQWAGLDEVRSLAPGAGEPLRLPLPEGYDERLDLYPKRNYKGHRWAMVVDLDRCTGCGACSVACYAENNLAVVGPDACRKGREMAWLKVTPYLDKSQRRLAHLPLPCMQCDAAPCEPVCPVFAAVHTAEGLNAQVYNRCIGTRYCSNNCPYKVRRFNWLDTKWESPLDWQLNPDVSVRCRGVMEKCTFCIQRIHAAEFTAKREGRAVGDGEIVPACAQTCPAKAIVFGDLADETTQVARLTRNDPRRYHVLEDLNTKPAVTYLRRIDRSDRAAQGPAT
jgi:Fe-S-cluster-containing dehydrogenase component